MMHFSTFASFLAATVVAVHAIPGTPVQERQATPTVYVQFFPDGGCHGAWVDDTVFAQNQVGCVNVGITNPYQSANFTGNTLTKQLKVYSLPNCDESGNSFILNPGVNQCFAQHVGSAKFL